MRAEEKKAYVHNGIRRLFFALFAILVEFLFLFFLFVKLNDIAYWITVATHMFAILLVLGIYSDHKTSSLKIK